MQTPPPPPPPSPLHQKWPNLIFCPKRWAMFKAYAKHFFYSPPHKNDFFNPKYFLWQKNSLSSGMYAKKNRQNLSKNIFKFWWNFLNFFFYFFFAYVSEHCTYFGSKNSICPLLRYGGLHVVNYNWPYLEFFDFIRKNITSILA